MAESKGCTILISVLGNGGRPNHYDVRNNGKIKVNDLFLLVKIHEHNFYTFRNIDFSNTERTSKVINPSGLTYKSLLVLYNGLFVNLRCLFFPDPSPFPSCFVLSFHLLYQRKSIGFLEVDTFPNLKIRSMVFHLILLNRLRFPFD